MNEKNKKKKNEKVGRSRMMKRKSARPTGLRTKSLRIESISGKESANEWIVVGGFSDQGRTRRGLSKENGDSDGESEGDFGK